MNNNFFQFTDTPFKKTPATKNYFENKNLVGLLNAFTDFIKNDSAFAILTGQEGTGKTSFVNYLMHKKASLAKFIYLQFPFLSADELVTKLIEELEPETNYKNNGDTIPNNYKLINEYLLDIYNQKRKVVFIIDEAHCLSPAIFEALRSLSSLVYNNTHLIKIILIGKNNLLKQLEDNGLDGITRQIFLYAMFDNLPFEDIPKYIKSELAVSGNGRINMSAALIKKITKLSNGNPKLINIYMERTLTTAALASSNNLTVKHLNTGLKACNYILPPNLKESFFRQISFDIIFVVFAFISLTVAYNHITKYDAVNEIISKPKSYIEAYTAPAAIKKPTEEITPIPEAQPVPEAPVTEKIFNAVINARSLNIRSEPDTTATVIGSYKLGDAVTVTDFNDEWVKTKVNGKTGYMIKVYLDIER